ncbi:hypothetical protein E2C01_094386 [Portunus trituberculatus]|uniref:Uncharacterized protein n=1 Tax=Portunus trituberculatus TaxID=210409 RepID=A0A5B7K344_PORTR|nr:hypothetical protein [Portunus trituberculatus]
METSQETRRNIVALHEAGHKVCYIAKELNIHRNTLTWWLRRESDSGATNDLAPTGRPRCTNPDEVKMSFASDNYPVSGLLFYNGTMLNNPGVHAMLMVLNT